MKLLLEDLEDLARGAAFLGTGGGGDPYIGRMLATAAIREFGMPELVDLEDLEDDAFVCAVAMLGAPTVLTEKAACGDDTDRAVRLLERHQGRKVDAIVPVEIGGLNSMIPLMAAARLGLPVVNADGMGRAFPEIQMVTFNIYGVPCTPAVMVDEHLNSLVIDAEDAKRAEALARVASIELGCSVVMSLYSMTARDLKRSAIKGTMKLALSIGRTLLASRRSADPMGTLLRHLDASPYYGKSAEVFVGKVIDLRRETTRGFSMGHCVLEALSGSGKKMEVTFQNEHLVAREGGVVKVIVPDLICMVDSDTLEPVPVEALRYGQRIRVLGLRAPAMLRSPEALAVVGPQAFGIGDPYEMLI